MQITADVDEILKTVQVDPTFILMFFQNLVFILTSFQ